MNISIPFCAECEGIEEGGAAVELAQLQKELLAPGALERLSDKMRLLVDIPCLAPRHMYLVTLQP